MRTKFTVDQSACLEIQAGQTGIRQRHVESNKTPSRFGWIVLIVTTILLLVPATAIAKKGGGGGGGGKTTTGVLVDYGDIFGDLIHILRYTDDYGIATGQPIFAQRWVEMPAELPGFGWGYCAIGLDEHGVEIPFLPYSCDLDTAVAEPIEVDYFGRLNASRVQERNQRMHFNETITNIKQADMLKLDPTGRLMLGFECTIEGVLDSCSWTTIDSPMENMAFYRRMMKYGHVSTSPTELDLWWHGDPKLPTPFYPALDADDFQKFFDAGLDNMLPDQTCWVGSDYVSSCADPEYLTWKDFDTSAILLGASASKFGFITDDLVQYLNRFLRITQSTDFAAATLETLPAMYRDCWPEGDPNPWKQGEEPPDGTDLNVDLVYGPCDVDEVDESIPNYDDFSNIQELFVDFGASGYSRGEVWGGKMAKLALESTPGTSNGLWSLVLSASLLEWVVIPNPAEPAAADILNFVDSASDALRAIEYTHNYEVPENLYCTYDGSYCE